VLAEDETDVLLFPPLRAAWAERGRQAEVHISGRNARRVIFGALNLRTGYHVLTVSRRQRAQDFCAFLRELRRRYRSQAVVLLVDEDASHTANASQKLAADLRIDLLWLPKRCPELNPMDHLWRSVKSDVCANHQDANVDLTVSRILRYARRLRPGAALVKAGTRSAHFWLRRALSNQQ
jgi:transposase